LDKQELSPEDREVLDGLEDPDDIEAFANICENAQGQGKTGVELIRDDPVHTSRKAVRKLCLKGVGGEIGAFMRRLFHRGESRDPSDDMPTGFTRPPARQ